MIPHQTHAQSRFPHLGYLLLACFLLITTNCATPTKTSKPHSIQNTNMLTVITQAQKILYRSIHSSTLHAEKNQKGLVLSKGQWHSKADIFATAKGAFKVQDYATAAEHFETLIELGEQDPYGLASLFNAGLCYEHLDRHWDAALRYRRIVEEVPDAVGIEDAYFRLAVVLSFTENWEDIITYMNKLLERPNLTHLDQFEAQLRKAWALFELGHWDKSIALFQQTIAKNNQTTPPYRIPEHSDLVAQLHFGIGQAFHAKMSAIPLQLPEDKMRTHLLQKAELFLSGQNAYIHALTLRDPRWSLAAGYRIGRLYQDFYEDILSAEIPTGLSPKDLKAYFEVVRTRVRPLIQKAINVYQKTLTLGKNMGDPKTAQPYLDATRQSIRHLHLYLEDPKVQARAERFVQQNQPLTRLFYAPSLIQDAIFVATKATTPPPSTPSASPNHQ